MRYLIETNCSTVHLSDHLPFSVRQFLHTEGYGFILSKSFLYKCRKAVVETIENSGSYNLWILKVLLRDY